MAQLLSSLPIGAKVKFGRHSINGETAEEIIWFIVAKSHSGTPAYPSNSVTLLTDRIIDFRAFDAKEPNNTSTERQNNGNNRYSVSNIDQWLNKDSAAGAWYVAQHSADQAPSANYVAARAPYDVRPGFLNAFRTEEKNAILDTTIRVVKPSLDGGGYEDITRKVFLPSTTEVGAANENNIAEGLVWSYFNGSTGANRIGYATQHALTNSLADYKPANTTTAHSWHLRTPRYDNGYSIKTIEQYGSVGKPDAISSLVGVRPAVNLKSTLTVSDETDADGCYKLGYNQAPPKPNNISVPTIYGGRNNAISWSSVTDPDGDAVTYQLECSVNGGSYTTIYSGTALNYAHLVTFGTSTIAYRVKAIDTSNESSAYTTSNTVSVISNNAPTISGSDANLGVKNAGFTGTYTVNDANGDAVTVTEAIDGVQIRAFVATLGATVTYGVTGTTWLALSNGSHTLSIRATDGIDTSVRTYTFTKLVDSFTIRNSTPWAASTMPSRIMVVVTRNIPSAATFKVEVCNNGFDAAPTWEDATDAVKSGLVHVFSNQRKREDDWGVVVRVTVERNGATGACYVSAIGGNFE